MLKKIIFCLAALSTLAFTGCNTVEGAGKDVSAAGHAVTDTARDTKHEM